MLFISVTFLATAGDSKQNKMTHDTRLHRCSVSHNHLRYHITIGIGIGTRIGIGAGKKSGIRSIGKSWYRSQPTPVYRPTWGLTKYHIDHIGYDHKTDRQTSCHGNTVVICTYTLLLSPDKQKNRAGESSELMNYLVLLLVNLAYSWRWVQ